ncbi:MAG TPA: AIR synthase-related protein, partial [Rhodothermia bacterium]
APRLDLDEERAVHEAMLALIHSGRVKSAHDVSDGGLAVCLAEKILETEGLGADVVLPTIGDRRLDVVLFGEDHSRIVFTVTEADADDIERTFVHQGVQINRLGVVTDELELRVGTEAGELAVVSAADMKRAYFDSIEKLMQRV